MPKDDFTFKMNGNRLPRTRFCFLKKKKKKETGTVEDNFTCNVVLQHDDLTLFYKKKIQRTYFYKFKFKKTPKYKKSMKSLFVMFCGKPV